MVGVLFFLAGNNAVSNFLVKSVFNNPEGIVMLAAIQFYPAVTEISGCWKPETKVFLTHSLELSGI